MLNQSFLHLLALDSSAQTTMTHDHHTPIHTFTYLHSHTHAHTIPHTLTHSSIHSSINASIHSFIHPFIHTSICSSTHPFINSSTHSSIHSLIHPFIHSFPSFRFLGSDNHETFFLNKDRQRIVYEILATTTYGKRKRAEIGIDRLLEEEVYSAAYPLHDVSTVIVAGTLRGL